MENPHDERQAVLLERIVRSTDKSTQLVMELNRCVEEIVRANQSVRVVAQLETKYRKNVEYNLKRQDVAARTGAPSSEP